LKYLKELIRIANSLDEKGLAEEASVLDGIISKASWFDEEGPSDQELSAMELGVYDPVGEDAKESLYERLEQVNLELGLFGSAISDGEMEEADWETYLEIKTELEGLVAELKLIEAPEEDSFDN
jgi:hypothetical protein